MIEIKTLKKCDAVVTIPGSKSYTHRALILSALAGGESILRNALRSEDTDFTAQALRNLGTSITEEKDTFRIQGTGGEFRAGAAAIFVGNSGTSMRFLTALAALRNGRTVLDGTERMRERPMSGLLDGLVALGVHAYSQEGNGCPPVVVESQGLQGGVARIKGEESSQYISALLMTAPLARGDVRVEVVGSLASRPYIDITRDVMSAFGAEVQVEGEGSFRVAAGQKYRSRTYTVEGDASNASYFLAAAAVTRGRVRVENFRPASVQGDAGFLSLLEEMGCGVIRAEDFAEVRGKELQGIEVDMNSMPDLVPTLAVIAALARGKTVMKNIGHLRLKESDRISTVTSELAKMGARVQEGKDWLAVEGSLLHGAEIETHNDHRLAMSFAIAGLVVPGVKILGEKCVEKSFPEFWDTLERLY